MKRSFILIFLLLVLLSIMSGDAVTQESRSYVKNPLKLTEYVTDETATLKPEEIAILSSKLKRFDNSTSTQIVVVLLKSLNGETIEEVANSIFHYNKIGVKGKDNGVLLLISKGDRKIRIEVGYGLEGVLPDVLAKKIIQSEISPRLKKDEFYEGINQGTDAIIAVTKGEYQASTEKREGAKDATTAFIIATIITMVIVVVLVNIIMFIRRLSRKTFIAGNNFSTSNFSSSDSSNFWNSNDSYSGSDSDSGFSGGGGDSGGGGASGDY